MNAATDLSEVNRTQSINECINNTSKRIIKMYPPRSTITEKSHESHHAHAHLYTEEHWVWLIK